MLNNYVLRVGGFVDFLNNELSDELRNIFESYFKLEYLRPRFLFGVGRQKIVLNNMYNSSTGSYGHNIERVANVLHSKKKTRHFSLTGFRKESWEGLRVDIVRLIELGHSKVIEPQNFLLHRVSTCEENITYLEQLRGPEQLAYEAGVWKFNN